MCNCLFTRILAIDSICECERHKNLFSRKFHLSTPFFLTGAALLTMKNKNGKTAFDSCTSDKAKDLFNKYASQNVNCLMNQSSIAASLIKEEHYQTLSSPSSSAIQDYLLLLSTLIASFINTKEEGVKCTNYLLKRHFDMLVTHVRLLHGNNGTSLKCKMYLRVIKDLLRV